MGAVWTGLTPLSWGFTEKRQSVSHVLAATGKMPVRTGRPPPAWAGARWRTQCNAKEGAVWDLFYIGLTIVVFAALWLLVKGVERFER